MRSRNDSMSDEMAICGSLCLLYHVVDRSGGHVQSLKKGRGSFSSTE